MGMNRRLRVLATLLTIAIACLAPSAAHAQGSGVTYDPDSPAGKEYALPLEQSRQIGGGALTTPSDRGRAGVASAAKVDALFGVGVQHLRATAASRGKGARFSGEGARSKSSPARPDGNSPSSPGSRSAGSTPASGASQVGHALAASGGRQLAVGLLIGAAALLLAGLATLVLRLRGRRNA
jgi:hypothetical protein